MRLGGLAFAAESPSCSHCPRLQRLGTLHSEACMQCGATTGLVLSDAGSAAGVREDETARPRPMQRDKSELPQGIADLLPDWVGYGFLYGLSGIPVFLVIAVVTLFFFSSLR